MGRHVVTVDNPQDAYSAARDILKRRGSPGDMVNVIWRGKRVVTQSYEGITMREWERTYTVKGKRYRFGYAERGDGQVSVNVHAGHDPYPVTFQSGNTEAEVTKRAKEAIRA